jgi:tRNA threonylcarbamoyladenosine biosynthesis protein TsaB
MKVLALELSSARGSIAFRDRAQCCFRAEFANDRKHSGTFFENLERCMAENGRPEQIVVGLGPGSYAGTRIAIATAIGLAAATGAKLAGIASICGMPTEAVEYAVIGDARRQSFFFAVVCDRRCVKGPVLCSEADLRMRVHALVMPVFSAEPLVSFRQAQLLHPSAAVLAEVAAANRAEMTSAPLEPIYLREPHITWPKRP